MHRFTSFLLGVWLVLNTPVLADEPTAVDSAGVVARVNATEIKRSELDAAVEGIQLQAAQQGRSIPPQQVAALERDILDDMISRELVLQAAPQQAQEGVQEQVEQQLTQIHLRAGGEDAFLATLEQTGLSLQEFRERLRDNLVVQNTLREAVEKELAITAEEVAAFYGEHRAEMRQPELADARHILIRVAADATDVEKAAKRAEIDTLRERLVGGADFAELARVHSQDPGSGSRGGNLGSFPRGRMVPEFDAAAFSLEPGTISEVITTPFGYHLLEVTSRTPARDLPLEEVRDQIETHLKQQKGSQLVEAYLAGLRQSANIEILLPAVGDN